MAHNGITFDQRMKGLLLRTYTCGGGRVYSFFPSFDLQLKGSRFTHCFTSHWSYSLFDQSHDSIPFERGSRGEQNVEAETGYEEIEHYFPGTFLSLSVCF